MSKSSRRSRTNAMPPGARLLVIETVKPLPHELMDSLREQLVLAHRTNAWPVVIAADPFVKFRWIEAARPSRIRQRVRRAKR